MGLKERRALQSFQENDYKKLESKIFEIANKTLEMEIDWNSLALDGMDHLYETALPKVYFLPIITALENICIDDMGKEAIAESLEKIIIQNRKDNHVAEQWATFQNKTLTLDFKPFSNIDKINERTEALQEILENNL